MDNLSRIYQNVKSGRIYGYTVSCVPYPYFKEVLFYNSGLLHWCHFGSSANKCTIQNLKWIIDVIFEMTPEEFERKYDAEYPEELEA